MDKEFSLFNNLNDFILWKQEWQGLPEFIQEDLQPKLSIILNFENKENYLTFSKLINQSLTPETISIWFPEAKWDWVKDLRWVDAT